MDMDGIWIDSDSNGIYDDHLAGSGDLEPEIFVGRLLTSILTIPNETEISLIQNYFDKNHAYRTQQVALNKRALVYVDDDWEGMGDIWSNDVGLVYNDRTLVKDPDATVASDYLLKLSQNYEWVSLFAHSNPTQHSFKSSSGFSSVLTRDIDQTDPVANFYNLYACSAGNYVYPYGDGYIAGHYVFSQSYGLAAVASTKTGGMLNFADFYEPLSYGSNLGLAFQSWFEKNGETGAWDYSRVWFYGMTLIGDPTLVPNM
jgi:hypothetical protein